MSFLLPRLGGGAAGLLLLTLPLGAQVELASGARYGIDSIRDLTLLRYRSRPAVAVASLPETDQGSISIFTADETGALHLAHTILTPDNLRFIESGDVDGDGRTDLVMASPDGNTGIVRCFLQMEDTDFFRCQRVGARQERGIEDLILSDLNNDGFDDIIVSGRGLSILLANGQGRFPHLITERGTGPLARGDIFVNGFEDLVAGRLALFNRGDQTFIPGDLPVGNFPLDVAVADMDRDGHVDIVITTQVPVTTNILYGRGMGGFDPPLIPFSGASSWLDVADLDLDGYPDLVMSSGSGFAVFLNDRFRSFHPAQRFDTEPEIRGGTSAFEALTHIVTGDLDEDGLPDVVGIGGGALQVFLNRTRVDLIRSRRGTVNEGVGQREDVLLVNGLPGSFAEREVVVDKNELLWVRMNKPGSLLPGETAPFVLYAWAGRPRPEDMRTLPFSMGLSAMPMPISGRSPRLGAIWNNTGHETRALGVPTHGSRPAPSIPFATATGLGIEGTFFLQGLILDPGSAALVPASVTNGIVVVSR